MTEKNAEKRAQKGPCHRARASVLHPRTQKKSIEKLWNPPVKRYSRGSSPMPPRLLGILLFYVHPVMGATSLQYRNAPLRAPWKVLHPKSVRFSSVSTRGNNDESPGCSFFSCASALQGPKLARRSRRAGRSTTRAGRGRAATNGDIKGLYSAFPRTFHCVFAWFCAFSRLVKKTSKNWRVKSFLPIHKAQRK